jgi:chromosome segregation ATPase
MDAAIETLPDAAREDYKSRPGALVWFFKKSRDNWKAKHQSLKASVKGLKNQLAAVTESRGRWRAEAEDAGRRAAALEAELAELRDRIAAADPQKKARATAR